MTSWEYQSLSWSAFKREDSQSAMERLNDLGRQGWEAVNMIHADHGFYAVLLKRPC